MPPATKIRPLRFKCIHRSGLFILYLTQWRQWGCRPGAWWAPASWCRLQDLLGLADQMRRRLLRVALGRLQDAFHILGLGAQLGEQLLHGTSFLFHTVAHRPKIIRELSPAIEWGETRGLRLALTGNAALSGFGCRRFRHDLLRQFSPSWIWPLCLKPRQRREPSPRANIAALISSGKGSWTFQARWRVGHRKCRPPCRAACSPSRKQTACRTPGRPRTFRVESRSRHRRSSS